MNPRLFKSKLLSRIFHITDPEGSYSFFINSIKHSKIVYLDKNNALQFRKGPGIPYFVCGGDIDDRDNNGLTLLSILLNFKYRYPNNVFLLVGNREIKNARFKHELNPDFIRYRLLHSDSPRWLLHETYPKDYVIQTMIEKGYRINEKSFENYLSELSIEECQMIYLHWMLKETLGSPHAFRYRFEELTRLNPTHTVSDSDVLKSFIKETMPQGLMGEYLQQAQVAVHIPNTSVLALHGGLTDKNIGFIPTMDASAHRIENLSDWIIQFNQWYYQQIGLWCHSNPTNLTVPGCTALDESVLPIPGKQKYIITADMLGANREFVPISENISQYLQDNGVSVVLTGHQPSGRTPAIVRDKANKVIMINGDTGRAHQVNDNPNDTRGGACHATDIYATSEQTRVKINATLPDQSHVRIKLNIDKHKGISDPYIGKILDGNQLIQYPLPGNRFSILKQKGHQTIYSIFSKHVIDQSLLDNQINPSSFKKP